MQELRPPRLLLLTLLAFCFAAAADESATPPPPEDFVIRGGLEAGKLVYAKKCAVCHGENGDGSGRIKLDPPARDLRDHERMSQRTRLGDLRRDP